MIRNRTLFSFLLLCVSINLVAFVQEAGAASASYFYMDEKESGDISPFPKWTGVVARFEEQQKVPDGDCGRAHFHPCSILEWKSMLAALKDKPLRVQMDAVNSWSNAHPYIEDIVNWGLDDYWATPYEFMEVSGDCEDYAISKYYSLKALGVPISRMRVIILQDLNLGGIIHAVLGVYDDDDNLMILDNQSPSVTPALKIYHYRPIFGINEEAWWAYYPK